MKDGIAETSVVTRREVLKTASLASLAAAFSTTGGVFAPHASERMSAYTGNALSWDWVMNASALDLTPPHLEFRELPPLEVPVPGRTRLV